jgi:hypothetical protein
MLISPKNDTELHELKRMLLQPNHDLWLRSILRIFDLPANVAPFEQRIQLLDELKAQLPSHIQVVSWQKCSNKDHLREAAESRGPIGMVLKKPGSLYQTGKSDTHYVIRVSTNFETNGNCHR